MTAYARHYFRYVENDQQYQGVYLSDVSSTTDDTADYPAILRFNECWGLWGGRAGRRRERAAAHGDLWPDAQHLFLGYVCGFCHGEYPRDVVARWCVSG